MSLSPEQAAEYSTPQAHIDVMRTIAEKIEANEHISGCIVDDWGRFSNFQLIVEVDANTFRTTNKGILTRKVSAMFDNLLKGTGAHRRNTFAPTARREWCSYDEKMKTVGYDRTYWMVDVDFHNFDASENAFDDKTIKFNLTQGAK